MIVIVYSGKMLHFRCVFFGDLGHVVMGINSLKTLPKSSKSFPFVTALIFN